MPNLVTLMRKQKIQRKDWSQKFDLSKKKETQLNKIFLLTSADGFGPVKTVSTWLKQVSSFV